MGGTNACVRKPEKFECVCLLRNGQQGTKEVVFIYFPFIKVCIRGDEFVPSRQKVMGSAFIIY